MKFYCLGYWSGDNVFICFGAIIHTLNRAHRTQYASGNEYASPCMYANAYRARNTHLIQFDSTCDISQYTHPLNHFNTNLSIKFYNLDKMICC